LNKPLLQWTYRNRPSVAVDANVALASSATEKAPVLEGRRGRLVPAARAEHARVRGPFTPRGTAGGKRNRAR
jgi:hypothetical protein